MNQSIFHHTSNHWGGDTGNNARCEESESSHLNTGCKCLADLSFYFFILDDI